MADLVFPYIIKYETKSSVGVREATEALLANEALIRQAAKILEEIYPGLSISSVVITLNKAESGSLIGDLSAALAFSIQKETREFVIGVLERLIQRDIPAEYEPVVVFLVVLLAAKGAEILIKKSRRGKADEITETPRISGNYNTVLNITAGRLEVSEQVLDRAVRKLILSRQAETLKWVKKFFRLAKKSSGNSISMLGGVGFDEAQINEIPSRSLDEEPAPPLRVNYDAQTVVIRALDLGRVDEPDP